MSIRRVLEWNLNVPYFGLGEAELGVAAELNHVDLISGEGEPVPFEHDLAASAHDFESVGAGSLAGRRDERAGRAIGIFEVGGDVVLHLDVVEAAELAEAAHASRHSQEPLHGVEIVQALVEQHSAALASIRRPSW